MRLESSLSFARKLDLKDPLKSFRKKFHIPKVKGKEAIYFAGNSLGLQPRTAVAIISQEMKDWAKLGVEGHVHGKRPWLYYHHFYRKHMATLAGALESEVVTMSQLTVTLHLMLASFYKPTRERFKIIIEKGAFSSDQYAIASHIRFHGVSSASLVELAPRSGEYCLRTDDIVQAIRDHGAETALVLLGGVQYYTGQRFDMATITRAGHDAGSLVAFDLAHAIGNVPLSLHDDGVDFAVWCGYKYLNGGPGAVAGAFVHERHGSERNQRRLAGWWGNVEHDRFQMKPEFEPMTGADGWQVSNFPVLSGAPLLASLDIFKDAGLKNLRKKSLLLTGFLEFLLNEIDPGQKHFRIITPANPEERGCQLSILVPRNGKRVFNKLTAGGVICDWREPDVIRVAPVPLYNTFTEVWKFVRLFEGAILGKRRQGRQTA
jgi:kynureninase